MVEEVGLALKQLGSLLLHHSFQGFCISSRDTVPGFRLTPTGKAERWIHIHLYKYVKAQSSTTIAKPKAILLRLSQLTKNCKECLYYVVSTKMGGQFVRGCFQHVLFQSRKMVIFPNFIIPPGPVIHSFSFNFSCSFSLKVTTIP